MKAFKWVGAKIADNIAGVVITAIGGSLLVFLASAREYAGALWDWFIAPVEMSRWLIILLVMLSAFIVLLLIRALLVKAITPEPPAWRNYREDRFEGALWRWDYNDQNVIQNPRPFCLVCGCALDLNADPWTHQLSYECVSCNSSKECFPRCSMHYDAELTIRKLIEHRARQKFYPDEQAAD